MRKRLLALCTAAIVCVCLLAACGSGSSEPAEETSDLVFSDVKVECSNRDGWFGGRYANFTMTGSVTNKSGNPVNEDNMPKIVAGDEEIECELSQDKLLDGETCDITYEGEFDITDEDLPTLSFSSKLSVDGLEDAEADLNSGLAKISEDYASKDAEKEAEEKAAQEQKEAEEKAAEEAKKAVEDCKGKTADEGLEAAKAADYSATFIDSADVDVTSEVEDSSNKSKVHKAKITKVDISSFWGTTTVTFTLDYEDPEAKRAREAEEAAAAEEAKRKEEENKVLTVDNCEDLSKLLDVSDPGDPFVAEFASKYDGRKIEFDAIVASVMNYENYDTRFDYLLSAHDDMLHGPNFKFENINYSGFKWKGASPDSVPVGTKLHIIAEVDRYEDTPQLFFLKPVETSVR